jgi:ATP-binding cassette subfamily B protein
VSEETPRRVGESARAKPRGDLGLYRRLIGDAKPWWPHLGVLFLLNLLATPVALLMPLPVKLVVDHGIGSEPLPGWLRAILPESAAGGGAALLPWAAAGVVLVALLYQVQDFGTWLWKTWVGEKLVVDFRARLFRHLQRLSLSFHDARGTVDSAYRVQNDSNSIHQVLIQGVIPFATSLLRVVAMVWVAALIDPLLALVALVGGPTLFLLTRLFRARLRRRWTEAKERESASMAVVQEALSAVRVVKAFGREDHERDRYVREADASVVAQVKAVLAHGVFDVLVGLVIGVGTAGVLWLGAVHVQSGLITLGELVLVMTYLAQLFQPLREIGTKAADLQRSLAGAERVYAVLDEVPEAAERPGARAIDRVRGDVELEGVSFAYAPEAGTATPVLRDVSFAVPAGARVGVVGRSGAGKTTLLALLPRFYDPTAGAVRLDGIDVRDVRLEDLRRQFAIVLQDPVLFSTSIRENIAYGKPGATEEEIVAAARAANADEFVAALPEGYGTLVGERGMRLSGGERQRVSLARAFLRDAPILILDEPTSSVDAKTEFGILDALERLMAGRTTFLIAHRDSTLEGCDLRLEVAGGTAALRGAVAAGS